MKGALIIKLNFKEEEKESKNKKFALINQNNDFRFKDNQDHSVEIKENDNNHIYLENIISPNIK